VAGEAPGWKNQFPAGANGCKLCVIEGRAGRGPQPGTSCTCAAESQIHEQSLTCSGPGRRRRHRRPEQESRARCQQASQPRGRASAEDGEPASAHDHPERPARPGTLKAPPHGTAGFPRDSVTYWVTLLGASPDGDEATTGEWVFGAPPISALPLRCGRPATGRVEAPSP
jgi:hypothetical protein